MNRTPEEEDRYQRALYEQASEALGMDFETFAREAPLSRLVEEIERGLRAGDNLAANLCWNILRDLHLGNVALGTTEATLDEIARRNPVAHHAGMLSAAAIILRDSSASKSPVIRQMGVRLSEKIVSAANDAYTDDVEKVDG